MKDQISSAIPAESAELRNDPPVDEQYEEQLSRRALEDLVWRIMDGTGYPKIGRDATCMDTILTEEADASEISEVIRDAIFCPDGPIAGYTRLFNGIEEIVRDHLRDSRFHAQRIAELREEDKEND